MTRNRRSSSAGNPFLGSALHCKRLTSVILARILRGERRQFQPVLSVATVGRSEFNRAPHRLQSEECTRGGWTTTDIQYVITSVDGARADAAGLLKWW